MEVNKNFSVGIFDDEEVLLRAVTKVREAGVKIHEVYTPYPVHHLEHKLGYKRSRLPRVAFFFGLLGTSLALLMQCWMLGVDWPLNIGGKPYIPLPAFIPVTFELTVLLSALGMVATFLIVSDLKPHKKPRIFDIRSTDDKFVMAVDHGMNKMPEGDLTRILTDAGAIEVNRKDFE